MIGCHQAAVNIIHSQLQMATHGLMGFFGVGAIHQLNQAGRTLVAVLLSCRSSSPFLQKQLVEPGLEALKSCVVLLRRFSVRYLCGLRSADLIEEFCRSKCFVQHAGAPWLTLPQYQKYPWMLHHSYQPSTTPLHDAPGSGPSARKQHLSLGLAPPPPIQAPHPIS